MVVIYWFKSQCSLIYSEYSSFIFELHQIPSFIWIAAVKATLEQCGHSTRERISIVPPVAMSRQCVVNEEKKKKNEGEKRRRKKHASDDGWKEEEWMIKLRVFLNDSMKNEDRANKSQRSTKWNNKKHQENLHRQKASAVALPFGGAMRRSQQEEETAKQQESYSTHPKKRQ